MYELKKYMPGLLMSLTLAHDDIQIYIEIYRYIIDIKIPTVFICRFLKKNVNFFLGDWN